MINCTPSASMNRPITRVTTFIPVTPRIRVINGEIVKRVNTTAEYTMRVTQNARNTHTEVILSAQRIELEIVPGPASNGIASGMIAILDAWNLWLDSIFEFSREAFSSWFCFCPPMLPLNIGNATLQIINPPAIRNALMEIPKNPRINDPTNMEMMTIKETVSEVIRLTRLRSFG